MVNTPTTVGADNKAADTSAPVQICVLAASTQLETAAHNRANCIASNYAAHPKPYPHLKVLSRLDFAGLNSIRPAWSSEH